MSELFRTEAIDARRQRLLGEVVIAEGRPSDLLVAAIGAVGAVLVLASVTGRYARTETAPGAVVTSRPLTKIMAQRPGLVTRVDVREGQVVHAGQTLAAVTLDAQLEGGQAAGFESLASIERQIGLAHNQKILLVGALANESRRLDEQLDLARAEHVQLRSQEDLQAEVIASSRKMFEGLRQVADTGYVSKFELERRRQEYLRESEMLSRLSQQRTANEAKQAELSAQLRRLPNDHAKQVGELDTNLEQLGQQRTAARGQTGYVITAPTGGRVSALNIAPGRSVDGRLPLLAIVPDGARFEAELYAPSRAIGLVKPGQSVRLMYDAFPYRQFGSFEGTVMDISKSIVAPGEIDVPVRLEEATYRVRIRLHDQNVLVKGTPIILQSGMALKANIVLERRTFFDWLLEPVRAVRNRSA